MLGSKKHLDMYLLDIFNKQSDPFPIPHCEVRHLVSVLGALLITKQRCSGVTRADVSARGAEVVSAQLIRCVRAATMHKARCGVTTAYCAWLEGIFTKKTRAQLHIRPLDMTPRHHNQLHPSPEQRTVQELEHTSLTRAWIRLPPHTHHTRVKFNFLLLAVILLQMAADTNAKYKIARVTTAKT